MHYDREEDDKIGTFRENAVTVVEKLQPIMDGKSYKSVGKQLQLLTKNDTCMKKKIQETMK